MKRCFFPFGCAEEIEFPIKIDKYPYFGYKIAQMVIEKK